MEQLLWTFEEVKRFANHPDTPLRQWALDRLTKRFSQQAGDVVVTMLDDPGRFIAREALDFLAETGETEKYGPILLERLKQATGETFGRLAWTLAKLGYRPALPVILTTFDQAIGNEDLYYLIQALGKFGGPQVRQTLWALLEKASASRNTTPARKNVFTTLFDVDKIASPTYHVTFLVETLLKVGQPEDIPRLVQQYRSWPFQEGYRSPLSAFAAGVEAGRLVEEMNYTAKSDLDTLLDRAEWWLNADLDLSDACFDDLTSAFENKYTGVFEALLAEARRLVKERGDDIAGWQAAWAAGEQLMGYQQRTLCTLLIFQAFVEQPATLLKQRQQEAGLGLGLLAQLSVDQDDQTHLDNAADKTETLLAILAEPREKVLPDIIDRVVALGPEIVPRLVDLFDPEDYGWGAIRLAEVFKRMARAYPGSCDAAIPKLIAAIHDEQGDYLLENCSYALEAIGLAAVEPVIKHLRSAKDMAREIYLTGVLAEIPTESAAQAILLKVKAGKPVDEMGLSALADIGSASAIEPLYRLWKPGGDHILAENLFILCELNGVQKPELPEWRRLVEAEEVRLAKIFAGEFDPGQELKNPADSKQMLMRTWQLQHEKPQSSKILSGQKKTLSKKEQKKRAAQRKGQVKGKKKKHRR